MTAFTPLPDVLYRIQNVDFGTFLELRTANSKGQLVMRPQKDGLQQQWSFVETAEKGLYKIQNAQVGTRRFYLSVTDDSKSLTSSSVGSAKAWSTNVIRGTRHQFIFVYSKSSNDNDKFLYLDDDGKSKLLDEDDLLNPENPATNIRWRVREVLPSVPRDIMLPKDTYRIRSLNGIAIQMAANSDAVAAKQQSSGDYQSWEVIPTGNGKCTIQNSGEKSAYLGWRTDIKTGFAAARKVADAAVWELTSFGGGYFYSVSMTYTVESAHIKLAISVGDDNEINLKPSKFAHNQIWLFEPTDGKGSSLPVDDPLPPPAYEQRYPEITSRGYYIRNCGYGTIWMFAWNSPVRVGPYNSQSYQFSLSYINETSGRFVLRWNSYAFAIANNTLVLDTTPAQWILDRNPADSSQYYICVAGDTNRVLSGDATKDVNGYDRYRIDNKETGRASQLWTLH